MPPRQVTFSDLGYGERADLQRLVQERLDVLLPDTMVLTDQFADWEDSRSQPRRLYAWRGDACNREHREAHQGGCGAPIKTAGHQRPFGSKR